MGQIAQGGMDEKRLTIDKGGIESYAHGGLGSSRDVKKRRKAYMYVGGLWRRIMGLDQGPRKISP